MSRNSTARSVAIPICHPNWNEVAGVNATNVAGFRSPSTVGVSTSGCVMSRLSRVAKLGLAEPATFSLRMFWAAMSAFEHT